MKIFRLNALVSRTLEIEKRLFFLFFRY